MTGWFQHRRRSPIGVDIGSRGVKLVQFDRAQSRVLETARWDLHPPEGKDWTPAERNAALAEALTRAREGRDFRGRDAVICLSARELFVQNVRVSKLPAAEMEKAVHQEAGSKLPFPLAEAELRYLEAADVRQGDAAKREVILLACHRPILHGLLEAVLQSGLRPIAVDVEPLALLRSYTKQFRRDEDRTQRAIYVHVGLANSLVVIARGEEVLFVKYIDVGGKHLDDAVAAHLGMAATAAAALRRHNGDRRADQQDPELALGVQEAIRGVVDRLAHELSLCVRYHSVTFRGQQLARLVLGGGEASPALLESLASRLDVRCELGDPLRSYGVNLPANRRGQWDVATGLALRNLPA